MNETNDNAPTADPATTLTFKDDHERAGWITVAFNALVALIRAGYATPQLAIGEPDEQGNREIEPLTGPSPAQLAMRYADALVLGCRERTAVVATPEDAEQATRPVRLVEPT